MRKLYTLLLTCLSFLALAQTGHTVLVGSGGSNFSPSSLTINQGDTVYFDCVSGTHNVDGTQSTYPNNPEGFGSGAATSAPWMYLHVFNTPGSYDYDCTPHAAGGMVGTITVNAVATPCSNLFFSEYIEGSSNNKGFEIYNPTSGSIDLGPYKVVLSGNGGSYTEEYNLTGMLASGDVFSICTNQSDPVMLAEADTAFAYPSVSHYNGDDALFIVDTVMGDTIDVIGVIGVDPGSNWPVGTGSTQDYTLVRMASVTGGQTDWAIGATEWDVYPQNTYTFYGSHTSNSCASFNPPTGCSNLFISEYIEGSSNNKGFEIYNPTSGSIDLGPYKVVLSGNGGSFTNEYNLPGMLASGDVYVITTDQSDPTMLAQADTAMAFPSVAHFNGDDALFLVDTVMGDTIDIVGVIGVDPGSNWPVGSGSTQDYTLVRMASVSGGQTDWAIGATEWDVYPQNTYTFFGSHTSNCIAGPATPTVSFISSSVSELESAGTVDVELYITPTSSNSETVDLTFTVGPGVSIPADGTIAPAPDLITGLLTLTVPANGDTVSFSVTIVDDQLTEANEYFDVVITGTSAGLSVGMVDSMRFTVIDNDIIVPTYTIDQIDGRDADCAIDSSLVYTRIFAVVVGVDLQGAASSNSAFTIWDGDGFGVFAGGLNFTVNEGDSIRIVGELDEFNGLAQIYADSITVLSSGATLPTPVVITSLDETTESELVRFNNAELVDPSQWSLTGSFNADITNGTDTITMRIDSDVNIAGTPAPVGKFDVIGIGGQFDNSTPRCEGYQLLPRYLDDIILPEPPTYDLHISEVMANSNDPNGLDFDWFEITNYSTTETYNLENFSFDDDSEIDGLNILPNVSIAPGEAIIVFEGSAADKAAWIQNWNIVNGAPQIVAVDELLNGSFPSLSSSSDAVVLYDSSANVIEICKVDYNSTLPGQTLEFDTACAFVGFAVDGTNGAHTANGGDVGSPGNVAPGIGLSEAQLSSIRIYPNPANENVFVDMPFEGVKAIKLMDIRGAVVEVLQTEETLLNMNLSKFDAGVYMLQIETGDAQRTVRVILQ
ncbi:MAG: lamin tail domain-containing protein [Flavobacteriia bacterium]|nr:lamin tail domain-containing protein [Flavobacteriia bacterium]